MVPIRPNCSTLVPASTVLRNVPPQVNVDIFQLAQDNSDDIASQGVQDIIDWEYTDEGSALVVFESCCNLPADDNEPLRWIRWLRCIIKSRTRKFMNVRKLCRRFSLLGWSRDKILWVSGTTSLLVDDIKVLKASTSQRAMSLAWKAASWNYLARYIFTNCCWEKRLSTARGQKQIVSKLTNNGYEWL